MTIIEQIKARWPLAAMLARCGIDVPAKGKFRSPFRLDNTPSCEIYGETIKDRSTGETWDVIAIFAEHHKIGNNEAVKQLAAELPNRAPRKAPKKRELVIPALSYCPQKAEALAKLRGFTREGVDFAATTACSLGFAEVLGYDCWLLRDGINIAEARRMDGKPFPAVGSLGERKSHTLAGSTKSFPIGLNPLHGAKALNKLPVLLVEGGPDYLAACSILWDSETYVPAAMLGSGLGIHPLALPLFARRDVLILAHDDDSGLDGAKRWARQLAHEGATPRIRKLVGGDLNDLLVRDGIEVIKKGVIK